MISKTKGRKVNSSMDIGVIVLLISIVIFLEDVFISYEIIMKEAILHI